MNRAVQGNVAALENAHNDDEILAWIKARVPADRRDDANGWLLEEKSANLDRQDEEEGVVVA